ncbi:MAG: hypothetical protein CMH54_05375 [Myxococcales bacterium]|nr:hypothetical protein [Myxococcales bacterium]
MKERAIEIKVGFLVLSSVVLLVLFVFALGDIQFEEQRTYYVEFRRVGGLAPGAPVKIGGVRSGKIQALKFHGPLEGTTGRSSPLVRVKIGVATGKAGSVREDASFTITTSGVLGSKYIEIDPGSASKPPLPPGSVVRGQEPFSIASVSSRAIKLLDGMTDLLSKNEGSISSLIKNADKTLKVAADLVKSNKDGMGGTVSNMTSLLKETTVLIGSLNTALGDGSEVHAMIVDGRHTAKNSRVITASVAKRMPGLLSESAETLTVLKGAVANYSEIGEEGRSRILGMLERLDSMVNHAEQLVGNVRQGRGLVGAILNDPELYDDIKEAVRDIKRHPWKLLWKE